MILENILFGILLAIVSIFAIGAITMVLCNVYYDKMHEKKHEQTMNRWPELVSFIEEIAKLRRKTGLLMIQQKELKEQIDAILSNQKYSGDPEFDAENLRSKQCEYQSSIKEMKSTCLVIAVAKERVKDFCKENDIDYKIIKGDIGE